MAVNAVTPVQNVPYDELRPKLLKLGQKLERTNLQSTADRGVAKKRRWESQAECNREKKGYEWVFVLIDKNKDGKVNAEEYDAFQAFKRKHVHWEKALRQSRP